MDKPEDVLTQAQEALKALLEDDRSEFCWDNGADDPALDIYWEIDNHHIVKLAAVLGVALPERKRDDRDD